MAAAQVGRDATYFTFGVKNFSKDFEQVLRILQTQSITVGQVFNVLLQISTPVERHLSLLNSLPNDDEEDHNIVATNNNNQDKRDITQISLEEPNLFQILIQTFAKKE